MCREDSEVPRFEAAASARSLRLLSKEATEQDGRLRRCSTLAIALFGKTSDDLRQQLLASHPKIPHGFSLSDFRYLQKQTERALAIDPTSPRFARSSIFQLLASRTISVGTQRYSMLEARYEIVRRTIDFLENQK